MNAFFAAHPIFFTILGIALGTIALMGLWTLAYNAGYRMGKRPPVIPLTLPNRAMRRQRSRDHTKALHDPTDCSHCREIRGDDLRAQRIREQTIGEAKVIPIGGPHDA